MKQTIIYSQCSSKADATHIMYDEFVWTSGNYTNQFIFSGS